MVSVGLIPGRVRVDGCTLDSKDWAWYSYNGLLTVNMLAVPSISDPKFKNDSDDQGFHDDVFRVQIDICKT